MADTQREIDLGPPVNCTGVHLLGMIDTQRRIGLGPHSIANTDSQALAEDLLEACAET
jgi:hypothetical protein